MPFRPAPFDVVEASQLVWQDRWSEDAATGMAVFTSILRSYELLREQVDAVLRAHHLTFARYEVLTWLATDPESSLALSWISKTLRIPPATVTDTIDRLEADGLVSRIPHPSDARTTLAVITDTGRELAERATVDLNTSVYEPLAVSDAARRKLIGLLAGLRAAGDEFDTELSKKTIETLAARLERGDTSDVA